jgi:Iron only hydrogenase large subunit, C-terminal domain
MDLLCRKNPCGDASIHKPSKKPSTGHGDVSEIMAWGKVGQNVSDLFLSLYFQSWKHHSQCVCFATRPGEIYHVTVMPCYDKKLEASRQDFYDDTYSTRDVDCVITTGELELLMHEKEWDISVPVADELLPTPPRTPPHIKLRTDVNNDHDVSIPELISHPGTSSGSYLHSVMSSIRSRYHADGQSRLLELSTRIVRSSDYEEYILTNRETGEIVFKGAKCYGFRNLQNVVRKVGKEVGVHVGRGAAGKLISTKARAMKKAAGLDKDKERTLDYVEVMACPGGCVNGGGQLKPRKAKQLTRKEDDEGYQRNWEDTGVQLTEDVTDTKWGSKEWTKEVERAYWHEVHPSPDPFDLMELKHAAADNLALKSLIELCQPAIGDQSVSSWSLSMDDAAERRRRELFRTQYKAVEGEIDGLIVKW